VGSPQAFGRYRVTSTLGAGAMGEVFLAVDDVLGREVAIKTLRGGLAKGGLGARILDERFRHEARAIAQLAHPAIVQVFDLDPTADPPYLVMERVAGPSLKERLAAGALPVHEARAMGIQIANALATAHAAGIVHRDVKPANILVAGPVNWKLADFGVAHVPDSSLTITGQFVGSPAYAPPEALVKGVASPAGDVYGLGATLYQALAGTWPRLDATTSGLLAPTPPLRSVVPELPLELAEAIDRAVDIDADKRPTAEQLAMALASRPSQELPAAPLVPAVQPARTKLFAIAGGLVALIVVIAILGSRGGGSPVVMPSPIEPTPVSSQDPRALEKWDDVQEKFDEGKYSDALKELDKWQREFDPARVDPNANGMRAAIESLPPGQRKKKKGKKHDD